MPLLYLPLLFGCDPLEDCRPAPLLTGASVDADIVSFVAKAEIDAFSAEKFETFDSAIWSLTVSTVSFPFDEVRPLSTNLDESPPLFFSASSEVIAEEA